MIPRTRRATEFGIMNDANSMRTMNNIDEQDHPSSAAAEMSVRVMLSFIAGYVELFIPP
jgi:hypothetical protein